MILRRFAANLHRQDWAAVVVELAVVVLGVFIGLQVDNWNEDRQTDARAKAFSERLQRDLREEAWDYEVQVAYYTQVVHNAERAADALSGKSTLSDEALLVAAYRATQYNVQTRRRDTYDELTSTGEIGLIRDGNLRLLASRVYTTPVLNWIVNDGRTSAYRKAFRMALPHDVQETLAERCGDHVLKTGDYDGLAQVLDYPCSTGLPSQVIGECARIIRGNAGLLPLLRLRIADTRSELANLTVYLNQDLTQPLRHFAREKP